MTPILFEDLVDQSGVLNAITNLTNATTRFGSDSIAVNQRIKDSITQLKTELEAYKATLNSIGVSTSGAATATTGLSTGITTAGTAITRLRDALARNQQVIDVNSASVTSLRQRINDLRTEYNSLDRSLPGSAARMRAIQTELRQTATATNALTTVTRQASATIATAEGSYQRLSQQTAELKRQLLAMPNAINAQTGAVNSSNAAAVALQRQISTNTRALANFDSSIRVNTRNVGNYGSAFKGIAGQLVGFTSVAAGVMLALRGIKAGIGIIEDMERYDSALKAVSRDSTDFSRSQQFLTGLADKLGLKYGDLVDSYKSLKAATKDTSLEGRNTEKMFSSVATAGAKLRLSSETVQGTLLALTQMISKGKIQAEELRGQLGERLPGALRLMSEALGVSETKLNKMMEQGELIATEVMPKFADSLDKAYGLKQDEKIENLAASTNRLQNEFNGIIKALSDSAGVNSFFKAVTDGFGHSLRSLKLFIQDGSWTEFLQFVGPNSFSNASARRVRTEDSRLKFGGMKGADRKAELAKLEKQETELRKKGDEEGAEETANLRRKLRGDNIKLELLDIREGRQKIASDAKGAVEKNEADLARFQKQAVKKRTAEIIALEKQLAGDPKNDVLAEKLKVYTRLDSEQKSKDKAVTNRLKSEKGDSASKTLSDSLSKSSATSSGKLEGLSGKRSDGLVDEQAYIEQRLKITLDGLNERQAILEKAGKKETDDYVKIQTEKLKANAEYNRSQLQLDLKTNKANSTELLADLDAQHNEGTISELEYVEKRHEIVKNGINLERLILITSNQEKTELYKATNTALDKEQADYLKNRLAAEKKAWKEELSAAKDGLQAIDQQTALDYENELNKVRKHYGDLRREVELAQAEGSMSNNEAANQLHLIDVDEIKAEMVVYGDYIKKSKQLADALLDARIEQLKNFRDYSNASEKEIAAANQQIAELEKLQRNKDAKDREKTQETVSKNEMEEVERVHKYKMELADRERKLQDDALSLATKDVDGAFKIEGLEAAARAIMDIRDKIAENNRKRNEEEVIDEKLKNKEKELSMKELAEDARLIGLAVVNTLYAQEQQRTSRQLEDLEKRKEYELSMAGDSANGKAEIERKYDNERKQIQRQQDQATRDKAIFEIAINTAVAIIKALPNFALAALVGGIGAIQLGLTLSQTLPEYFAGKNIDGITNDKYAGPATIAEQGRELWFHNGKTDLVEKQSRINVGRNDVILPNWLTERVLNDGRAMESNQILSSLQASRLANYQLVQGKANYDSSVLSKALRSGPSAKQIGLEVAKAMADNPTVSISLDKNGFSRSIQQQNTTRTEWKNRFSIGKKSR